MLKKLNATMSVLISNENMNSIPEIKELHNFVNNLVSAEDVTQMFRPDAEASI